MFLYMAMAIAPVSVVLPISRLSILFRLYFSWLLNAEHEVFTGRDPRYLRVARRRAGAVAEHRDRAVAHCAAGLDRADPAMALALRFPGRWNGLSGNAGRHAARLLWSVRRLLPDRLSRRLHRSRRRTAAAGDHDHGAAAGRAAPDPHGRAARLGRHAHAHHVALRHVQGIAPFVVGAIIGAVAGAKIFVALPITMLQGILGLFIVTVTGCPGSDVSAPNGRASSRSASARPFSACSSARPARCWLP